MRIKIRFRYGGQVGYYTGPGAGIVLCGARWYNPYTARWMTRDPIGYEGGADLYGYCGESPLSNTDPSGLDCGGRYWLGVESTPPRAGDGPSGWDLLPVIGSGRDIYYGIENGNPLRFGTGVAGLVADTVTSGAGPGVRAGYSWEAEKAKGAWEFTKSWYDWGGQDLLSRGGEVAGESGQAWGPALTAASEAGEGVGAAFEYRGLRKKSFGACGPKFSGANAADAETNADYRAVFEKTSLRDLHVPWLRNGR